MIRINLLPPEIVERRQTESRILIFGAIGLVAVTLVGLVFAWFSLQAGFKAEELAQKQQEVADIRQQADQFKIFEVKKQDLAAREQIASAAFAGKVNWSRVLGEMALVLPADMWLVEVNGAEAQTTPGAGAAPGVAAPAYSLLIRGAAVDRASDTPDGGHKSIAKLLVRLADLEQLKNVWLTSSEKIQLFDEGAINFEVTADVADPSTSSTTTGGGSE